jgi:predicted amidohydrolase
MLKNIEIINENNTDIIYFPELSLTGYMIKDISFEIYDKCVKAIEIIRKTFNSSKLFQEY